HLSRALSRLVTATMTLSMHVMDTHQTNPRRGKCERPSLSGGLDVLIDAEKIRRIVFALDRREARIVVAVGSADALVALVFQIVDVNGVAGMRLQRGEEILHPSDGVIARAIFLPVRLHPVFKADTPESERIVMLLRAPWAVPVNHRDAARFAGR